MVRQIEMQRCYGYVSTVNGVEVSAGVVINAWFLTPEPKILSSARISFIDNLPDK
jgi:hypothetical protein